MQLEFSKSRLEVKAEVVFLKAEEPARLYWFKTDTTEQLIPCLLTGEHWVFFDDRQQWDRERDSVEVLRGNPIRFLSSSSHLVTFTSPETFSASTQ